MARAGGTKHIIVVGGGLAGLCCARTIHRAGHIAHLYEADDEVGGRVRTDIVDGFRLDRGFQVLFTAYPAIRQEIDLAALDLRHYEPGALVYRGDRFHTLADPLRAPNRAISSAASSLLSFGDKLKCGQLAASLLSLSTDEIFRLRDNTMGAYLREFGFSDAFLDNFIRPFFGGVFLERQMASSARMFAFVFKMLATGRSSLPAAGIGALANQMATELPAGSVHVNSPVRELVRNGSRVSGIRLESGDVVEADRVVVAVDADTAARLTGIAMPVEWRASTQVMFALPERLYSDRLILLFPAPDSLVNNASLVTNVAPEYAPPGQHLLSATILGSPDMPDEELAGTAREQIAACFRNADSTTWRLLRILRIRQAQFAQPPGIWDRLPSNRTETPGLILAGEITSSSSLHGALVSGQKAAGLAMSADPKI